MNRMAAGLHPLAPLQPSWHGADNKPLAIIASGPGQAESVALARTVCPDAFGACRGAAVAAYLTIWMRSKELGTGSNIGGKVLELILPMHVRHRLPTTILNALPGHAISQVTASWGANICRRMTHFAGSFH